MRAWIVIVVVLAGARVAHADASADVTKALTRLIESVAANKPLPASVVLFVPPDPEMKDDDRRVDPVAKDLTATSKAIAGAKLKQIKVMISKTGKSAWIAGELTVKSKRDGKAKTEPIRISAFVINDDQGWHVQATHWSLGEKDVKTEMCGMRDPWGVQASVPKAAVPIVESIYTALLGDWMAQGSIDTSKFAKLLSDDKNALAIGSAPGERFVGGAKIKSVFKKWQFGADKPSETDLGARAAIGPDGEMAWVAMNVV